MVKQLMQIVLLVAAIAACVGCQTTNDRANAGDAALRIHYVEIVCRNVNDQCAALARIHGVTFGQPSADLGYARVAGTPNGSLIGVRAPLAEQEAPIARTYFEVADIEKAAREAEAAGAMIAYPPTKQGDTGTWAIYLLGDVQVGLWQR